MATDLQRAVPLTQERRKEKEVTLNQDLSRWKERGNERQGDQRKQSIRTQTKIKRGALTAELRTEGLEKKDFEEATNNEESQAVQ